MTQTLTKQGLPKTLNQLAKKKATHIMNKFALQKFDWFQGKKMVKEKGIWIFQCSYNASN